jgi:hypothetical protein
VSKRLHTLPTVFTREAGRFWTSCDQKRLKYSANRGGCEVRRLLWHRKRLAPTLQRDLLESPFESAMAPAVGFGAVFPCIFRHSSSLGVSNQANPRTTRTSSFIAVCWQFLLAGGRLYATSSKTAPIDVAKDCLVPLIVTGVG